MTCMLFCAALLLAVVCLVPGCRKQEILFTGADRRADAKMQADAKTQTDAKVQTDAETRTDAGQRADENVTSALPESETQLRAVVVVHVCGAVLSPGVYTLEEGARVCDAVEAAGGFTDEADTQWCNLALCVSDSQKVQIPTREETALLAAQGLSDTGGQNGMDGRTGEAGLASPGGLTFSDGLASPDGRSSAGLNINTATAEELTSLPGIGPAKAQAIIDHRNMNGPFSSVDDLVKVSGIGNAVLDKIRPLIRAEQNGTQ